MGFVLNPFCDSMATYAKSLKCQGVGDALPSIPGLGMIVDLRAQKYLMTPKRQDQIVSMAKTLLESRTQRSRRLAQIAVKLE